MFPAPLILGFSSFAYVSFTIWSLGKMRKEIMVAEARDADHTFDTETLKNYVFKLVTYWVSKYL